MSNLLEEEGRIGLDSKINPVPVGGLDKVSTFIALLSGSKLNIACLLDSPNVKTSEQKLKDLICHKLIREKNIRYYNEFTKNAGNRSDIEDLFTKGEYLKIFNEAFPEYNEIKVKD